MKRERRLLLSGLPSSDSIEVLQVNLGQEQPELEIEPIIVPRKFMAKRPSPHPWERETDEWYGQFKGANWIWSTRCLYQPNASHHERIIIRRYFSLPVGAKDAKINLRACAVGNMEVRVDNRLVDSKVYERGADNFYAELNVQGWELPNPEGDHVLYMPIERWSSAASEATVPAGVIYVLELTWRRTTKLDLLRKLLAAWFSVVTSKVFRALGLLGFLLFLWLALKPGFDETRRTVFATIAIGFLGAWLSPLITWELEKRKRSNQ